MFFAISFFFFFFFGGKCTLTFIFNENTADKNVTKIYKNVTVEPVQ